MFNFNFIGIEKLLIKIGFKKKPERIGVDIKDSSHIKIYGNKFEGMDRAVKMDNVRDLDMKKNEIK